MGQKILKRLGIIFLFSLLISGFIPSVANAATSQFNSDELNEGLEKDGVLRVGMEANYAPFNWSQATDDNGAVPIANSSGEYANGYDAQIAKYIADTLGLKLEIVKLEWDGLPPALESGKIDAIIAGMSPNPDRRQQIDFSNYYYASNFVIVVQKDSKWTDATSISDFKGAHITAQLNTLHYDLIDQINGVDKQTAMKDFPTMISSLSSGKIDGYISEEPGAMAAVASNPDLTYVTFDEGKGFDYNPDDSAVSVGLRKGSPLVDPINQVLAGYSDNKRSDLMSKMVALNTADTETGFWQQVGRVWKTYGSQFIRGAWMTLLIAIVSTIIGFIIGLIIAIIRTIDVAKRKNPLAYWTQKVVSFLLTVYIEIFRGTPMMVQAMLIFYGSKLFFNIDMTSLTAAFLIVSINTGAYLAEVVRGGITGVDPGQEEAAKAIGMTHLQTMIKIVLPQAIRSTLPAIGNEFVINIKDTSVLNVIAVTELFFVTSSAAGSTYLTFQSFLIASIIYFVLTFATTRLLKLVENRMSGTKSYELYEDKAIGGHN